MKKNKKLIFGKYGTYKNFCTSLIKKYGPVKYDYFANDNFTSKNHSKIGRGNEGLVIHHIYENKGIMLCNPKYARLHSFEYQKAKNLLYCNYFEHLILHMLICFEKQIPDIKGELLGFGGVFDRIDPEIVDHLCGWTYSQKWKIKSQSLTKKYYKEFINTIACFLASLIYEKNDNFDKFLSLVYERRQKKITFESLIRSQSLMFYGIDSPKITSLFLKNYTDLLNSIKIKFFEIINNDFNGISPNNNVDINSFKQTNPKYRFKK